MSLDANMPLLQELCPGIHEQTRRDIEAIKRIESFLVEEIDARVEVEIPTYREQGTEEGPTVVFCCWPRPHGETPRWGIYQKDGHWGRKPWENCDRAELFYLAEALPRLVAAVLERLRILAQVANEKVLEE